LETLGDVDTPDTPIPAFSELPTDSVTDFPMSELEATEERESVSEVGTVGEIGTLVEDSEYTLSKPSHLFIQTSERGERSLYPKPVDEPDSWVATGNLLLLLPSPLKQ